MIWKPEQDGEVGRTIWLRVHAAIQEHTKSLIVALLGTSDFQDKAASTSTSLPNPLVQLNDLTGEVDSFEIMGPKAARVLRRIFRIVKSEGKEKAQVSANLASYHSIMLMGQFFESLRNIQSGEIPEGMVAGLQVHDLRLM